jgi:hypothetical protein
MQFHVFSAKYGRAAAAGFDFGFAAAAIYIVAAMFAVQTVVFAINISSDLQ